MFKAMGHIDNKYTAPLTVVLIAIGRALCGISVGISSYIVPLYSKKYIVRELAPIEIYTRLGSINQFMITFGILVSYITGSFFEYHISNDLKLVDLLILLSISLVVSVVQILLFTYVYTDETPTYLLKIKDIKAASMVITKLYFNEGDNIEDLGFDMVYKETNFWDILKGWKNDEPLKMGCILSLLQQLTGINYLIVISSKLIPNDKLCHITPTVIIGFVNCITGSISVFLLRKHYKKNLFYGALGMCLCYICIIILRISNELEFELSYVIITLLFIMFFEFSIGPILWIYCADILSEKGVSITCAVNWAGASFNVAIFAYVGASYDFFSYRQEISFIIFNCFCLFCCATVI